MGANDPQDGACMDPRGMVSRIYKEDHYTLLNTNMKAPGLVVLEKKIFLCFSHDAPGAGPVRTPGARLAGFIKRTTIHCYTLLHTKYESSGPCGFGEEDFLCFSHCNYGSYLLPWKPEF